MEDIFFFFVNLLKFMFDFHNAYKYINKWGMKIFQILCRSRTRTNFKCVTKECGFLI